MSSTSSGEYKNRELNLNLDIDKVEKLIKIVYERPIELKFNGYDIEMKCKLSEAEAKKTIKNIFGTTDLAMIDCSDMTDEEIDRLVDKWNSIPKEYVVPIKEVDLWKD